jgi:hypothetical protein
VRSNSSELHRRITDVVDEMIPMMPADDGMSTLVARLRQRILKAAAEEQASYVTLLAAATTEISAIMKERGRR